MELYRKLRPTKFEQVRGQEDAVVLLMSKLSNREDFPHVVLLTGPTGSGKTTIARIIVNRLGCTDLNLTETNCAEVRGIDSVREMQEEMRANPMGGPCRVYILDEIVQLPKATQQAFLKVLEELTPKNYVLLLTTDITGLIPTFLGRCFRVDLQTLSNKAMRQILTDVIERAELKTGFVDESIIEAIITKANGDARRAVQCLEAVMAATNSKDQLRILGLTTSNTVEKIEFLAVAIMKKKPWSEIVAIISAIEEKNIETIRFQVLAYAEKCMLNPSPNIMAYKVIQAFRDPWTMCGRAGLVAACFEVCRATN